MLRDAEKLTKEAFFSLLWGRAQKGLHVEMRYTLSQSFGEGRIFSTWGKTGEEGEWLAELEQAFSTSPHNIHFTPAPRKTRSGSKSAVACVPALWTDIDNKSPEQIDEILANLKDIEIPPSLLVSSGWGTYLFWLLESPAMDTRDGEYGNRIVSLLSEGDMGALNVSHTLRSPGSRNWKTSAPRDVEAFLLLKERYDWEELLGTLRSYGSMLNDYEKEHSPSTGVSGERATGEYKKGAGNFVPWRMPEFWEELLEKEPSASCPLVKSAVANPNEVDYEEWLSMGSALCIGFQDDREGEKAFHSLSALSSLKYNPADCSLKWAEIRDKGLKPWGCERLTNGARCSRRGECRGILSVLGRSMPRKGKTIREG